MMKLKKYIFKLSPIPETVILATETLPEDLTEMT